MLPCVIAPTFVGDASPRSIYRAPDLESAGGVIPLDLLHVESAGVGNVWLRYAVTRAGT